MNGRKVALRLTCGPLHLVRLNDSPGFPVALCPVVFKKMNPFMRQQSLACRLLGEHPDFIADQLSSYKCLNSLVQKVLVLLPFT